MIVLQILLINLIKDKKDNYISQNKKQNKNKIMNKNKILQKAYKVFNKVK